MRPSSVIALSAACVALLGIGALVVTRPAQAHKPTGVLDTATPTFTGTPPTPCGTTMLTNGGFESGSLAPWIVSAATPAPLVSMAQPHTGSYSVLLGTLSGPEPAGD